MAELHRARGTLLDYYAVYLAEGPWSPAAYLSAMKQARRFAPKLLDYSFTRPPPVSLGPHPQQVSISQEGDDQPKEEEPGRVLAPGEGLLELIPPPPLPGLPDAP